MVYVEDSDVEEGCRVGDVSIMLGSGDLRYILRNPPTVPCYGHIETKVDDSSSDLNCSNAVIYFL